mgnify:CR=1 FL=1
MEKNIMKLGNNEALGLQLVEDLSDTNVPLGDYIRLKGLNFGDIIYLRDDGSGEHVIVVGNGTPFEGVTSSSERGWDYKTYNMWIVNRVYRISLELNGTWLHPNYVKEVAEIAHNSNNPHVGKEAQQ